MNTIEKLKLKEKIKRINYCLDWAYRKNNSEEVEEWIVSTMNEEENLRRELTGENEKGAIDLGEPVVEDIEDLSKEEWREIKRLIKDMDRIEKYESENKNE